MKGWFHKLQQKSGASIVIALVVFLIVSMISLVVVQAALTNAARVQTRKQDEQGYLNVKSAVALLENEFLIEKQDDGSTSAKYILVTWEDEDGTRTYHAPSCGAGFDRDGSASLYGEVLMAIVQQWLDGGEITPHTLTITPSGTDGLGSVTVNIGVIDQEDDLDLFCVVRDDASGYTMRVLLDGKYDVYEDQGRALLYFIDAEVS